jgi:hypothetical protein
MAMKHVRYLAIALILALMCGSGAAAAEKRASDPEAVVTAASGTAAAIVGADQGKTGTAAPKLVSIAITPPEPYLFKGMTQQFTATGNYSDKTTQDITASVKWNSSNTKVVAINSSGLATAGDTYGSASVTASFGGKRGSVKLIVTSHALASITIKPADKTIDKGATLQFTATGNYSDKTTKDLTATAKWSSSDTTVAEIDPAGLVKAGTKLGTATVTASVKNKVGSTVLTVSPMLISIVVTPADASIRQRTTLQFKAKGTFSDGSTRDLTSAATWTSEVPSVAGINAEGLATGFGVGPTTVSATYGNKSGLVRLLGMAREVKRPCAAGDDENRKGSVKWPAPRFTNVGGTTPVTGSVVVDQFTGHMWTVDSNTPGPAACVPAVTKTLQEAIDYIACLNTNGYLGYRDWRLPNRKELFSLTDYEQVVSSTWVSTQGFSNVQDFYCYDYWLSTMDTTSKDMGIFADLGYGAVYYSAKSSSYYVWPVRGGK